MHVDCRRCHRLFLALLDTVTRSTDATEIDATANKSSRACSGQFAWEPPRGTMQIGQQNWCCLALTNSLRTRSRRFESCRARHFRLVCSER